MHCEDFTPIQPESGGSDKDSRRPRRTDCLMQAVENLELGTSTAVQASSLVHYLCLGCAGRLISYRMPV